MVQICRLVHGQAGRAALVPGIMTRLVAYLVRMFSVDALALFAIVSFLLFLAQVLRTFDVVTVKGQDLLTLAYQTLLSMPSLVVAFAHLCIGIGLARGLGAMQQSQELHIIHTSRRTRALFGAIAIYTALGTLIVLLLLNVVDPLSRRQTSALQADIAADLVRRTLTPNRFIELTPGVTLVIGSRGGNGEIGSFFADDRRGEDGRRQTYIARSATLAIDDRGYVVRLRDGTIQNMSGDGRYSEIAFATYDLAIDRLARSEDAPPGVAEMTTHDLVARVLAGEDRSSYRQTILRRLTDGLKTVAICVLVTALAAFPAPTRRRRWVPLELVVLVAAFVELGITTYAPFGRGFPNAGAILMLAASSALLAWRLRPRGPVTVAA